MGKDIEVYDLEGDDFKIDPKLLNVIYYLSALILFYLLFTRSNKFLALTALLIFGVMEYMIYKRKPRGKE